MRRLALALVLVASTACLDFDARVDAGCDLGATWPECRGGTGDAGDDAGSTGDGGAPSRAGWTWENPTPLGAADLFAVWGHGTDVWVGGIGPTLARFDGTAWVDERRRLPSRSTGINDELPAILAVAVSDAGSAWLMGTRMGLVELRTDGGTRVIDTLGADHVAAASDYGVTIALRRSNTPALDYLFDDGTSRSVPVPALAGAESLGFVGITPEGVWVTYQANNEARAWSSATDASVSLRVDGGASCTRATAFARRGTGLYLSCNDTVALRLEQGAWVEVPFAQPTPGPVTTQAFYEPGDGGATTWWLSGQGGYLYRLDESQNLTVVGAPDHDYVYASWLSPAGDFWVVGSGGRVAVGTRAAGGGDVQERGSTPQPQPHVRDLAVRGAKAVAVGYLGASWVRDPQTATWASGTPLVGHLAAVTIKPGGAVCVLDQAARILCDGTIVKELGTVTIDGGATAPGLQRSAGIEAADDGTLRAAMGSVFALQNPDGGGWSVGPHVGDRDQASQVIATATGAWVASNYSTDGYALRNGAVALMSFTGSRQPCTFTEAVLGIAAIDGGVLVVGPDLVATCTFDPQGAPVVTADPSAPMDVWTSAWVDPSGAWWIVADTGRVLRRAPGAGWTRELAPLSTSPWAYPNPTRITGNDREVFIGSAHGGILRRALP